MTCATALASGRAAHASGHWCRSGLRSPGGRWASAGRYPKGAKLMASSWFESVAVAQHRARKRLPAPLYGELMAGSERGQSRDDNVAAFAELGFAPHVAGNPAQRDLAPTVDRKSTRLNSSHVEI